MVGDYTRRHLIKGGAATGLAALVGGCLGGGNGNGSTQEEESTTPGPDTPVRDDNSSGNSNTNTGELLEPEQMEWMVAENTRGEMVNYGVYAEEQLNADLRRINRGLTQDKHGIRQLEGFSDIESDFFEDGSGEIYFIEIETGTEGNRYEAIARSKTSQETKFSNFNQINDEEQYEKVIEQGLGATMIEPTTFFITRNIGPDFSIKAREPDQNAIQELRYVLEDQNSNSEQIKINPEEIENLAEFYNENALDTTDNQMKELGAVANYKREGNSLANI